MTRNVPSNSILPNKSRPFSIVWADDTDSICDLSSLLTYLDNVASNRHKADATRSFPATGGSARRASNGAAAPSSLPSPSSPPQPPLFPSNAPAATPAPIYEFLRAFTLVRGDLDDMLTRSGSFAFLGDLSATERLFELYDFRISRVMPKGEATEQFAACMHLVLSLADKYPRDSIAPHILDVVAQFLPALLTPCNRRGRVRQIVANAKRFQCGEWKGLWETALRFARKESDINSKRKHNRAKRDTSIQARVVYAEHCARRGALSKANQTITSNQIPNADPIDIEHLRTKHPETAHPDRDPVRISSILWPRPHILQDYWSSDAGIEFLDKWFSIPKIHQYFRTRSPVRSILMVGMRAI